MEHMSLQEITTACGGTYYGEPSLLTREVSGVAMESRKGFFICPDQRSQSRWTFFHSTGDGTRGTLHTLRAPAF